MISVDFYRPKCVDRRYLCEHFESTDVLFYHARKAAKQALHLAPGDRIVLTGGTVNGTSGNTNLIRVDTIQ